MAASHTDDLLVSAVARGDSEAEHQLFTRFRRLVWWCVHSRASAHLTLEDAFQVGQVGLWKAAQTYRVGVGVGGGGNDPAASSFRTYATRCIQNEIVSAARSAGSKGHLAGDISLDQVDSITGEARSPEPAATFGSESHATPQDQVDFEMTVRQAARELYEQLTDRERQVLTRFLVGDTYLEISRSLGISYKAVDGAVQRIKKKAQNTAR